MQRCDWGRTVLGFREEKKRETRCAKSGESTRRSWGWARRSGEKREGRRGKIAACDKEREREREREGIATAGSASSHGKQFLNVTLSLAAGIVRAPRTALCKDAWVPGTQSGPGADRFATHVAKQEISETAKPRNSKSTDFHELPFRTSLSLFLSLFLFLLFFMLSRSTISRWISLLYSFPVVSLASTPTSTRDTEFANFRQTWFAFRFVCDFQRFQDRENPNARNFGSERKFEISRGDISEQPDNAGRVVRWFQKGLEKPIKSERRAPSRIYITGTDNSPLSSPF